MPCCPNCDDVLMVAPSSSFSSHYFNVGGSSCCPSCGYSE